MSYNPIREGSAHVRDENGSVISDRVVWAEDATQEELDSMFAHNMANFAIVENHTKRPILVTDEPVDGEYFAEKLIQSGVTNWHILRTSYSGPELIREEPEDFRSFR